MGFTEMVNKKFRLFFYKYLREQNPFFIMGKYFYSMLSRWICKIISRLKHCREIQPL